MKNFTLCVLAALTLIFGSCSKEKQLEKRLSGNTWNIDKIEWVKQEVGMGGVGQWSGTETNAGTFTFTETTGTCTMTIEDDVETNASFSWSVSSGDQINMTYDLTIVGTSTTQRVMAIEENKKKSQTWVLSEQKVDSTGTFQMVATLELSR